MLRTHVAMLAFFTATAGALNAQTPADPALPDWRRGGVCYEIFVRSFQDSDGDGVGDLRGLIEKLDHVNDGDPATQHDLGASCIWLMPVGQSPSYHGYDVTNYYQVNREYGTNEDFKRLVAEAQRRGIAVLVDLVLNHMSSEHPFFKSALLDPGSPYRDWFLWSPEGRRVPGWEATVWHRAPTREEYYYGLFWHGMPDLNLASPEVRAEARRIARFWLEEMGVDGFRLDAVGHFFEEGDRLTHAPAAHPWLRDYADYIRQVKPGAFTIGEVWDSTGAILPYYPDQLDAHFIFEVSDALIEAVRSGAGGRLMSAVARAQRDLPPGRWSPFLRNHDQTRTATAIGTSDPARLKLAASLLLTMPGLPFLYYGEEIGMTGDKPDPRLRTPMQWAPRPGAGFTRAVPWEPLQPDSLSVTVEQQDADPGSLLNHYRRLIHLRRANPALGSGDFLPLDTGRDDVVAFLRRSEAGTALVVANLGARRVQELAISSPASALAPGRYLARPLLGGASARTLRVAADGRIGRWAPLPALEPHGSYVFGMERRE